MRRGGKKRHTKNLGADADGLSSQAGNSRKKSRKDHRDYPKRKYDKKSKRGLTNANFEHYYKSQNIVSEDEFETLLKTLRTDLPVTFRINGQGTFSRQIRERFQQEFSQGFPLETVDKNGEPVVVTDAPAPLAWYPDDNAWRLGVDRNTLRRTPILKPLHNFLIREYEVGVINRQEEVSMIPPFLLNVQPDHAVLDMCASPGSKTMQLLEAMHKNDAEDGFPSGMIVANDVNPQRAYMLVHQCKRLASSSLTVTAHAAQWFPNVARIRVAQEKSKQASSPDAKSAPLPEGTFDRILADVPCSGDGTLRKAPDVWYTWGVGGGMALHPLQLKIAMRGIALLKVGGLMVYSTCSINPTENESVVADLLARCKGSVELVDCSDMLPNLKRRPGLKTWKVAVNTAEADRMLPNGAKKPTKKEKEAAQAKAKEEAARAKEEAAQAKEEAAQAKEAANTDDNKEAANTDDKTKEAADDTEAAMDEDKPAEAKLEPTLRYFNTHEEFMKVLTEDRTSLAKKIPPVLPSMFPPSKDAADSMHLERCMRLVPHDQNTGGFFICLLKKVAPMPVIGSEDNRYDDVVEVATVDDMNKPRAKIKTKGRGAPPQNHIYYPLVEDRWMRIKEYYGIADSFPGTPFLFTRSEKGDANTVSLMSPLNEKLSHGLDDREKLHIVHSGIAMFRKNERPSVVCEYRLYQDGVKYLIPHMTKRIEKLRMADVESLLLFGTQLKKKSKEDFAKHALNPGMPVNRLLPETYERMKKHDLGCMALTLVKEDDDKYIQAFGTSFVMVIWRGRRTLNPLVNDKDLKTMYEQFTESGLAERDLTSFDVDQDKADALAALELELKKDVVE